MFQKNRLSHVKERLNAFRNSFLSTPLTVLCFGFPNTLFKLRFSWENSIFNHWFHSKIFCSFTEKKKNNEKKKKVAPGNKLSWGRKVVVHLFLFSSPKIEWTSNRFKSQRREPTASKSFIQLHTMKVSKGGSCLFRRSVTGFCFF